MWSLSLERVKADSNIDHGKLKLQNVKLREVAGYCSYQHCPVFGTYSINSFHPQSPLITEG